MDDREAILSDLPPAGRRARPPVPAPPLPTQTAEALWLLFRERLESLGGRLGSLTDLEALLLRPHTIDQEAATRLGRGSEGASTWDAEIGFTSADLAVAETASIVIAAGPGRSRMTSLSPPIHVVVIPRDRIVATPEEAFARLSDRTTVFITGPSRTADIEGVLVRGVHGPREIIVIPI